MKLRVYCPAKVNLYLAVGPRDRRGYHPLRTVFQAVGLYDLLDITFGEVRNEPAIEVAGADLPAENTISRALRLSREIFAIQPAQVRLEKRIPMESGLGGGSSDAAGVLRALRRANIQQTTTHHELESVASAIGADVPFFLTGGRALGEGYGDKVTPMPDPSDEWFVIAMPERGCSTADMYSRLDLATRMPSADVGRWDEPFVGDPNGLPLYNDFEAVAPDECLDLIERLRELGAEGAALSGSGSAVFGCFGDEKSAQQAKKQLSSDAESWVAKSLTRTESLRVETR